MRQREPRIKDKKHLDYVRGLSCVVCGDNTTVEAAHIRTGNWRYGKRTTGMGERPDDRWTLPLCGVCHRAQHTMNEKAYWLRHGIDPFRLADAIYKRGKRL